MCPRCKSKLWDTPKLRPVRLGNGLGIDDILTPHRDKILALAKQFGVKRLQVFGSVRRKEADDRSDVDLLVEWKAGASPLAGLDLTIALKEVLERRVDLVEEERLHWSIRPHALAEAVPL